MDARTKVIKKFVNRGMRILDVGCHLGILHDDLIREYSESNVCGLDMTFDGETGRFIEANAEEMPFAEDVFDAVMAGELIEHVERPEAFVAECARVVRPNGIVIISTPNVKSLLNRIFKNYRHVLHKNLFDKETLMNLLERHGLEVIHFSCLPYTKHTSRGKCDQRGFLKNFIVFQGRVFLHYLLPNELRESMVLVSINKKNSGRTA